MAAVIHENACKVRILPRVLVVDDEPGMIELVGDVVARAGNCRLVSAANLAQAEKIIANEKIDLLLATQGDDAIVLDWIDLEPNQRPQTRLSHLRDVFGADVNRHGVLGG